MSPQTREEDLTRRGLTRRLPHALVILKSLRRFWRRERTRSANSACSEGSDHLPFPARSRSQSDPRHRRSRDCSTWRWRPTPRRRSHATDGPDGGVGARDVPPASRASTAWVVSSESALESGPSQQIREAPPDSTSGSDVNTSSATRRESASPDVAIARSSGRSRRLPVASSAFIKSRRTATSSSFRKRSSTAGSERGIFGFCRGARRVPANIGGAVRERSDQDRPERRLVRRTDLVDDACRDADRRRCGHRPRKLRE